MLNLKSGALVAGLLVCASAASAQESVVIPPTPDAMPGVGAPLYHCVKYKDLDNVAPCAVPTVVQVKDPCACDDPCNCCAPQCVSVQICVPPCAPCGPKVTSSRDGSKVTYDYGKYQVEITSRNGVVTVDYDD